MNPNEQPSRSDRIAYLAHGGLKKQKHVFSKSTVRGSDVRSTLPLSNPQIKPGSEEQDLERSRAAETRPAIDSRTLRSRDPHPRTNSAHPATGHAPPSKHLRAPSDSRNATKLRSTNEVGATTKKSLHERTISKIGLPASKPKTAQDLPPRQDLINDKAPSTQAIPRRTISHRTTRSTSSTSAIPHTQPQIIEAAPEGTRELQAKLLQLHILHSASAQTHRQWQESAKLHFQKQFDELVKRHAEIADIAHQTQELRNRSALVDWCRNLQAPEIARRVHTLSSCIQDIYENLDPGGKYSQVIGAFEAWFARAREVQESRRTCSPDHVAVAGYVEELGAGWQNDVDALQRRLSTLTGDLRTLGSASLDSTLGQLLVMLQDLVIDMLAEVDCIRSIECEIVAQEEVWMEEQIRSLSLKVHNEMGGPRKTPKKRCEHG
ncbi:MAG: hypothetical protein L6R39_001841 [Caloplaca ligustica]|nr:MAG: hypothetical protein L6R39_001841 [Caloplaca ligustica]